jgi:hypothetical protein
MNKITRSSEIEKVMKVDQETQNQSSTVRKFILITLIHAEVRLFTNRESVLSRVRKLFECRAIVIAKEKHQKNEGEELGEHFHVGIWARDASKNTLRKKIRKEFPEWTGRAIDISLHKGWGSICLYIMKEDKEPLVWGEFTLEQSEI